MILFLPDRSKADCCHPPTIKSSQRDLKYGSLKVRFWDLNSLLSIPANLLKSSENMDIHFFPDDHRLYMKFRSTDPRILAKAPYVLSKIIQEIRTWMACHFLKLNDSKIEFLLIGPQRRLPPHPLLLVTAKPLQ